MTEENMIDIEINYYDGLVGAIVMARHFAPEMTSEEVITLYDSLSEKQEETVETVD